MRKLTLANKLFIFGCLALIILIVLKVPHEAPGKTTSSVVKTSTED